MDLSPYGMVEAESFTRLSRPDEAIVRLRGLTGGLVPGRSARYPSGDAYHDEPWTAARRKMVAPGTDRAAELVLTLELQPHPEGGQYRELFRSAASVQPEDGRGARAALTTIYFLLRAGERSRLHRVESDEAWHHYEGAPLELLIADGDFAAVRRVEVGPVGPRSAPVEVVPAGSWQAARSAGEYTLVGCTVAPGFDFADFRMIGAGSPEEALLRWRQPALLPFL